VCFSVLAFFFFFFFLKLYIMFCKTLQIFESTIFLAKHKWGYHNNI